MRVRGQESRLALEYVDKRRMLVVCEEMLRIGGCARRDLLAALDGLADLNNVETRGQRLLELLSLLLVVDRERVEEARASDLELGHLLAIGTGGALDAGGRSVLSASNLEEFLDVGNLLRLLRMEKARGSEMLSRRRVLGMHNPAWRHERRRAKVSRGAEGFADRDRR